MTWSVLVGPPAALAVPGPDSTVIVANLEDPDSIALADLYRRSRAIPRGHVCALSLPSGPDLSLDDYLARVEAPLEACLRAGGVLDRLEAVVLTRGVPLRVSIPTAGGPVLVSLAAALGVWKSSTRDGTRVLGYTPGVRASCGGTPCVAAGWPNPYRSGPFRPGWEAEDLQGVTYRPLLVTLLTGRSFEDAARLVTRAVDGEGSDPSAGTFLLMEGADPARAVRDVDLDRVLAGLAERGLTNGERVAFDPELSGRTLAAFFTGTAAIGSTIEGNTFLPGSVADNVTSFGAVPENLDPSGAEVQVSIARWITAGISGVHGTVDEPLNNCFPDRTLLLDLLDGSTLGESFFRAMPYVYWKNLVVGDVMAAPYAVRPEVSIEGVEDGEHVTGARRIWVRVSDLGGHGVASLRLLAGGTILEERAGGAPLERCYTSTQAGEVELLAVAAGADDGTRRGAHTPKGWASRTFTFEPGAPEGCDAPDAGAELDGGFDPADTGESDAGTADLGADAVDAGVPGDVATAPDARPRDDDVGAGCGCDSGRDRSGGDRAPVAALLVLGLLVGSRWRRGARRQALPG